MWFELTHKLFNLFIFKYLAGLLFVTLQVTVFCAGVFLCLGLRLNDWEWLIFAAIPLVVVFFSYLFSVNVLIGVWTRSALTALLVTFLLWFGLYSVTAAETIVNMIKTQMVIEVEQYDQAIANLDTHLAAVEPGEEATPPSPRAAMQTERDELARQRDEDQADIDKIERWHKPIRIVRTVLPKTGETIALADRWLRRDTDINIMDIMTGGVRQDDAGQFTRGRSHDEDRQAERRVEAEAEARSEFMIIGSSLAFEAVVLLIAGWIFVRRDY